MALHTAALTGSRLFMIGLILWSEQGISLFKDNALKLQ